MSKLRWSAYGSGVGTAFLLYLMVLLVVHVSRQYLFLVIPLILAGGITVTLLKKDALRRLRGQFAENWGKEVQRKRDVATMRLLFDSLSQSRDEFTVDDRTFEDLDMDVIFAMMDRTMTVSGQQYLYNLLRTPLFSEEPLIAREQVIRAFQENQNLREELQIVLHRIEQVNAGDRASILLWDPPKIYRPPLLWLYHLLFLAAILSPLAFLASVRLGFFLVVGVYLMNAYIHSKEHGRIFGHFSSIKYISRYIRFSKQIANLDQPDIAVQQRKLTGILANLLQHSKTISRVDMEANELTAMFVMYANIFFLAEARGFYKAMRIIEANRKDLQDLFLLVGELDALLSLASYRHGLSYYCQPTFIRGTTLQVVDAYHPLVEDPVANSVTLTTKGMLVTGSNMSGKSTFLRSMGLNALLAQTIYMCYARNYTTSFFQLLTSIGRSDNVIQGESYYLVEAKLILRILRNLDGDQPTLCIIDEMYRGTNTEERITASYRVLKYIAGYDSLALVATHDLELTELLAHSYLNFHFSEKVGAKGLEFDYRLKAGPSTTRNAIALLKLLGYPDSVVSTEKLDSSGGV